MTVGISPCVSRCRFTRFFFSIYVIICFFKCQEAVKAMAPKCDAMLVVGAPNSSNSRRLVEVGARAGCSYAQLVQRATDIDWRALDGITSMGITAGASAPEVLINEVIDAFRDRYDVTVEMVETAVENVEFKVPRVLREAS